MGSLFNFDPAKKTASTSTDKKDSFDDFFEGLMKGQSGATPSAPGSAPRGAGGVNLDAILSSLNKPVKDGSKEEGDARLRSVFLNKKPAEPKASEDVEEWNAMATSLDDDSDFVDFMKALKTEQRQDKPIGSNVKLPPITPKLNVKMPSEMPDLTKVSLSQATELILEDLKKHNPNLVADSKTRFYKGPYNTRSETEAHMTQQDALEHQKLKAAEKEILASPPESLPMWVTEARVPDRKTGGKRTVNLLAAYADPSIAAEAEAAMIDEDKRLKIDDNDFFEDAPLSAAEDAQLRAADADILNNPAAKEIFEQLMQQTKNIEDMEYWSLFPTKIKRWLIYTRTPRGFYNDHGEWEVIPESDDLDGMVADYAASRGLNQAQLEDEFGIPRSPTGETGEAAAEADELGEDELPEEEDDMLDLVDEQGNPLSADLDAAEEKMEAIRSARAEALEKTRALDQQIVSELSSKQDWDYWEGVYQNEQQYLPEDLRGQFRFFVEPEEISGMHPKLRRHFSFKFATEAEIRQYRGQAYIRKWGKHPGDTGNSAVQIAILTLRINHLTKVLRSNTSDSHNGYRLQELVRRRKGLMKHLKRRDLHTYYSLLKDIELRDQVELWTASRK